MTHHTTQTVLEGETHCAICGEPFLYYWENEQETKGRSDTTTKRNGKVVHYICAGGKTLHQLNEERKDIL